MTLYSVETTVPDAVQLSQTTFSACFGSVQGTEHLRIDRNNQDGAWAAAEDGGAVAVVCDGCSAGAKSEVGARLFARRIGEFALRYIARRGATTLGLMRAVEAELRFALDALGRLMCGRSDPDWIADHLLFTYLIAVATPQYSAVFGQGDGAYVIDGVLTELDPGPDNAPDYAAYDLLRPRSPLRSGVALHHHQVGAGAQSLLVATDGAGPILQDTVLRHSLVDDPRYSRNRSLLQKSLRRANQTFRVRDDATIAQVRRAR